MPIYDTLGQEATKHIVHHAELCTIVASLDKAKYLLELMNSSPGVTDAPVLDIKRLIVIADELNEELTAKATTANGKFSAVPGDIMGIMYGAFSPAVHIQASREAGRSPRDQTRADPR